MKKILLLIGIIPLVIAIASCGICSKKVSCPAFEDEVLEDWFPLEKAKSLSFRSAANQLQTFTFDITTSEPYRVIEEYAGGCSAYKQAISKQNDLPGRPAISFQLTTSRRRDESDNERTVSILLFGLSCFGTDLGSEGLRKVVRDNKGEMGMLQYYPSVQLAGKTFTNVQSIYFDTTGTAPKSAVYKLYISRQNGLIAYETYQPGMLWVKE